MPFFMHQWSYKETQIRDMVTERQNREEIIRAATEVFGGKLHHFFFSFGEFDGVAITEFPDLEKAMSCVATVVGQGRLRDWRTTPLLTPDAAQRAFDDARAVLGDNPDA